MLTTLLIVLMSDNFISGGSNMLTRSDGIVLVLFFLVFVYYLFSIIRHQEGINDPSNDKIYGLPKSIIYTITGLVAIVIGSDFVVDNASSIASNLGVSERIVGLTIIAIGTSLPELVTSITATRKGEYDIAIGNVVGSNIFNIGLVLGIPISLFGGISVSSFNYIDLIFFFVSAVILFIFSANDYKLRKVEGLLLLTMFIVYYIMILF